MRGGLSAAQRGAHRRPAERQVPGSPAELARGADTPRLPATGADRARAPRRKRALPQQGDRLRHAQLGTRLHHARARGEPRGFHVRAAHLGAGPRLGGRRGRSVWRVRRRDRAAALRAVDDFEVADAARVPHRPAERRPRRGHGRAVAGRRRGGARGGRNGRVRRGAVAGRNPERNQDGQHRGRGALRRERVVRVVLWRAVRDPRLEPCELAPLAPDAPVLFLGGARLLCRAAGEAPGARAVPHHAHGHRGQRGQPELGHGHPRPCHGRDQPPARPQACRVPRSQARLAPRPAPRRRLVRARLLLGHANEVRGEDGVGRGPVDDGDCAVGHPRRHGRAAFTGPRRHRPVQLRLARARHRRRLARRPRPLLRRRQAPPALGGERILISMEARRRWHRNESADGASLLPSVSDAVSHWS